MSNTSWRQKLARMRQYRPDARYYAITLLIDLAGKLQTSTLTEFDGYVDGDFKREWRVASRVVPANMIKFWKSMGQGYVVVEDVVGLYLFMHIGGNALVESSTTLKFQPHWIEKKQNVRVGRGGWTSVTDLDDRAFVHAPTPKHRMRILNRDRRRCRMCGRSPDTNVDIELQVHHIRPFGSGGITHDDNLITLCHTCHAGLDPHEDPELFELVDSGMERMVREVKDEYWPGVQRYRQKIKDLYKDGHMGKEQAK